MATFESNKRNKKKRKSSSSSSDEDKDDSSELKKKESIEELIKIEPELIEKRPMTRRRGSSIGQTKFMKEIEEYVEQNIFYLFFRICIDTSS